MHAAIIANGAKIATPNNHMPTRANQSKFDIYAFFKTRPLSWSALSCFEYDKEEWYRRYILNQKNPESAEMKFGKALATSIEDGTCPVPGLLKALQKKKEHEFRVVFGRIHMIGYADAFCDKKFRRLDEVKSGKLTSPWGFKRADEHGQITMYALFNFITNKVKPEDTRFTIYWVPTVITGDFVVDFDKPMRFISIPTKRTMQDVLVFGVRVNRVAKEMEEYVRNHK